MKEAYTSGVSFRAKSLRLISLCDDIINEYVEQGYKLTVRQIYYQLVARGHVENTMKSYDSVQSLLNDARLAGLIDWDAIEDRTREIISRPKWTSGGEILTAVTDQYHEDVWDNQPNRPFVIVEKEALAGVLEKVCHEWSVPLLPARGYPSASTLREIGKSRIYNGEKFQRFVVLHLGDHDPSGIDMSRDLEERLDLFARGRPFKFKRIALNMDQIKQQQPPPNPAKVTDSRYETYRQQFGEKSWELDALTPQYLHQLVTVEIKALLNMKLWNERNQRVEGVRVRLQELAETFDD